MDLLVAILALVLSGASFAAFCIFASMPKEASKAAEDVVAKAAAARNFSDVDISKLLESAAKLVESLSKAGPSLASLGASVLFLSIAAYVAKPDTPSLTRTSTVPAGEVAKPPAK